MDLLGTTLEKSIIPVLNQTIRKKQPFPTPLPGLENTNVLISRYHNRPRDRGSSWVMCCVDDRRKRVLCAISPRVADEFYNTYKTEITEETGLVIRFTSAPQLSLVSGSFIDSLPPFLPVQYDPHKYRGISDARMTIVVTKPIKKVTQGALLQHLFVPMLSVAIDPVDGNQKADKPMYPPDRRAKKRPEFQSGYHSQKISFADLQLLAQPSRGSLEDARQSLRWRNGRVEEFEEEGDQSEEYETNPEPFPLAQPRSSPPMASRSPPLDYGDHIGRFISKEPLDDLKDPLDVDDDQLEYWTSVFDLLKPDSPILRRTPFLNPPSGLRKRAGSED